MKNICFLIFCIAFIIDTNAQSPDQASYRKISIIAANQSLGEILREIEKKGNVVFSYPSSLINTDSLLTLRFENQELRYILSSLFKRGISYKINYNDVILYASQTLVKEATPNGKARLRSEPLIVRDTVVIFKTDTVIQVVTDTIVVKVIDTVVVSGKIDNAVVPKQKQRAKLFLGFDYQLERNRTYYDHFGYDQGDAELREQIGAYESPLFSFRSVLKVKVAYSNLVLSTGIGLHDVRERFDFYHAASDINPVDTNNNGRIKTNSLKYIIVPVTLGWFRSFGQKFQIGAEAGLWVNILASSTGTFINMSKSEMVLSKMDNAFLNRFVIEASAGIFGEFRITRNLIINAGPSLFMGLSSEYTRKYPVTKRRHSIGLQAGLQLRI